MTHSVLVVEVKFWMSYFFFLLFGFCHPPGRDQKSVPDDLLRPPFLSVWHCKKWEIQCLFVRGKYSAISEDRFPGFRVTSVRSVWAALKGDDLIATRIRFFYDLKTSIRNTRVWELKIFHSRYKKLKKMVPSEFGYLLRFGRKSCGSVWKTAFVVLTTEPHELRENG